MKRKSKLRQLRRASEAFKIPPVAFPDKNKLLETIVQNQEAMLSKLQNAGNEIRYGVPENVAKGMAAIATNAWKAKTKMVDGASGEVREEMKRIFRHIEGIFDNFQEIGLEIKDHTGDPFDYGLPLKVITTQQTPGITKDRVLETIKPTIYWQKQIIQMGEVVVATPASPSEERQQH
jgi:hypothetical protein